MEYLVYMFENEACRKQKRTNARYPAPKEIFFRLFISQNFSFFAEILQYYDNFNHPQQQRTGEIIHCIRPFSTLRKGGG